MKLLQLSIQQELQEYIKDLIQGGVLTLDNTDDWHFHAFNEEYYIVYDAEAEKWLARHNISAFEAIGEVKEYEEFHFGECNTDLSSPASVVNMYVYILESLLWLNCVMFNFIRFSHNSIC